MTTSYFPTLRGWVAFIFATFSIFIFQAIRPALFIESGVGTFLLEPVSPLVQVTGAASAIISFLASTEAFRRGSRADKVLACISVLLTIGLMVELLELSVLSVYKSPT